MGTRHLEATVNLILYNMETAIEAGERRGVEQICLVFDLSGFGPRNMDYEVVRRLIQLLADYYPERLGQILLLNAPAIFSVFWRVIRPCIDPVLSRRSNLPARACFTILSKLPCLLATWPHARSS